MNSVYPCKSPPPPSLLNAWKLLCQQFPISEVIVQTNQPGGTITLVGLIC